MRSALFTTVLAGGLCLQAFAAVWTGSWACSPQLMQEQHALAPGDLHESTLRQIVHLSTGGAEIRLHLSNAFGSAPLHLASVHIAKPVSNRAPGIVSGTDRTVYFSGREDVIIPAGAEYISDPLAYAVAPGRDLAISIYYQETPAQQTGHPGARATSYMAQGNQVSAANFTTTKRFDRWYQISGVDVLAEDGAFSIVALGDSITDGHGATTNGNDRWPDVLARRLSRDAKLRNTGVLNAGIGGNHLLTDGIGQNALARFDRDVLGTPGIRYVIVLEGINDLGALSRTGEATAADHAELVRRIIAAYEQLITRAHAHHLRIYGATILPDTGSEYYHPDAASEADRQAVNAWIRTPGHFDGLIDFDRVTRDPSHPDRLRPAFDCGDHLHPSPAGYAAMANSIDLALFSR